MKRIVPLISHESPLSLLDKSLAYNDYNYILVHLLEQEPRYLEFYEKCCKDGRRSIMDTSIFELGTAFDTSKYAGWVSKLQPTEYILPDVLEDCQATLDNSEKFMQKYPDLPGKKIGVVQGETFAELSKCYRYLNETLKVDKIAISFDYSYYKSVSWHPNKWVSFMTGRVWLINELIKTGVLNKNKPHHLLGCSNPLEFSFYKDPAYNFIESIDTASPIVHGLHEVYYEGKIGDWEKVTAKLADLISAVPTKSQLDSIFFNINKFRSYVQ